MKLTIYPAHYSFPDIINMESKIKQDNIIPTSIAYRIQTPKSHSLVVIPFFLSRPPTSNATTIKTHKQPPSEPTTTIECPTIHNNYKLQATTPPKSDQTLNPKAKQNKTQKMKPTKWRSPIGLLNSGCCWVFI